ncbi:MAG: GNAT family N-acetyltransferase [Oscillibacter sp.]|nr:GNAT family N-acetyltransferase [Oscillibacter sp.]
MVRALRKTDLEQVMELWLDANTRAHDFIPARYWADRREMVGELLPQAEVLVWEEDGVPQGFCGLNGDHLEGLFVRYGAQSRGIGKALLDAAKGRRDRLTLDVYQKNLGAAAFYRREGFGLQSEGVDENTGEAELHLVWECRPGVEQ